MKKPTTADLRTAVTNAARKAFTEVQAAHSGEKFYTYALYTNEDANNISASANTEEGLIRRAKHYPATEKKGAKEHARTVRWSPADWAYHCIGEKHFEEAQKLLDAWWKSGGRGIDGYEKKVEAGLAVFVEALKALEDEGFFGRGIARQGITVLVMMGDQETKLLLKCAKQLNPVKVFNEFSKPFLRSTAGKFKSIGSSKVYETVGVSVSRNGSVLACAGSSASGWPCLFACSLPAKNQILRLLISETIGFRGIAVSPEGATIIAGWQSLRAENDAGIRCWDVRTKKTKWNVQIPGGACCLDLSPDGAIVATGSMKGLVCLWDARSGKLMRKISGHKDWVQCVRFSPSGKILASSDREKDIRLWDCDSGKQLGKISDSGDCITFSPDGKYLAVAPGHAEGKKHVSIWDARRQKLVARLDTVTKSKFQVIPGPDDYADCRANAVAFSPDGRLLLVVRSWPGSAVIWDWKKNKELIWMNPNYECLNGAVFLPAARTVAVAGRCMSGPPLLLWDTSTAAKIK